MRRLLIVVLAGATALVGLLGAPATAASTETTRLDIVALVNAERASVGDRLLTADACLMANAQRHAERLARKGLLAHQDMGRISHDCGRRARYGENVLWTTTGTAREALRLWLASPDHRANIHEAAYRTTGIGVAHDRHRHRFYVVEVFAGR